MQKNGSAAHLYVSAASLAFIRGHGKRTYKLLTPGAVPVLKLDLVPKVGKHKPVAASAPQPRTCKQTVRQKTVGGNRRRTSVQS